jgi:twinkle protein
MKFLSKDSLCEQGRIFLADRGLSIPVAEGLGLASANGEIAFPFVLNGELVRVKYRSMTNKKAQRFDKQDESSKANFKMPFWNQQIWPTSDYLIITEGELDAIALIQLGASNVVSLPNGAGSVVSTFKNQYDYLQRFDLIYVAFDMDEAGQKAVEEAKKLIPPKKFRRIVFPCKDANEWLKEESPTLEDLQHLMRNAVKIVTDEIVPFRDLPTGFFDSRDKGIITGWRELDRLIGGIRRKELTVISADTGAGKTTFCINVLCNLLSRDPSGFWINSWEMDYEVIVRKVASVVLRKRFKTQAFDSQQIASFKAWMERHNALINPKRSKADIPTLHKQMELASRVYGVKYVLLDHLDYISGTSKEREVHERIKEAMVALHEMAMEFDVHIFLIAHAKQTDDRAGEMHMGQLRGGASIKQYADNILLLQNMAQGGASTETENRMKITVAKNRFLGSRGELFLRYISESDSYEDNNQILYQRSDHEES